MKKTRIVNVTNSFLIIVVFIFVIIIAKLFLIGLGTTKVGSISLSEFASNRNTRKDVIAARRGTIYSSDKEVLAKDVNSYTVIAYLSSSRTSDSKHPHHVVDKEETAKKLSPLINMTEEKILSILNTKIKSCDDNGECTEVSPYQVELGPGGRGITELVKDEIDDLGLPGIDFISSTKRYYPNGDFLSYTLGYARMNDKGVFKGEMGIEYTLNDKLTGTDGYIEYQADKDGYQITTSPTREVESIPGSDVYLTIDTNIQMFAEEAIKALEASPLEWATVSVMDAKSGKILGVASSPSFNNNTLEIKSYYDPFVSYEYEPGSVMKTFSFMAAMENGIYNGDEKYKSGSVKVDEYTIRDWNKRGWGEITYDEGFMASSNVAASNLALSLGRAKLKDYYTSLGFGKSTGTMLANEMKGNLDNIRYNSEIASASYGQGMTVTAVQMLQALSSLTNDGEVIKPYIIDKIVNPVTNEVYLQNEREVVKKVASTETVNKMIELMRGGVDGTSKMSTGTSYYLKGYDLVGKTGTAEIAGSGGYLKNSYVKSFGGIFPGNDPKIIIYVAASKLSTSKVMYSAVKDLVKNISTYLNIYDNNEENEEITYTVDNYYNKNVSDVEELLKQDGVTPIIIGDGDVIINQYPSKGTILNLDNKVFLITNGEKYKMIDINKWSRGEVELLCKMYGINVTFEGYGYVKEYSIKKDSDITKDMTLNVKLEGNYIEKDKKQE